ncbi:MAG TPA: DUF2063 domain-containing protein [Thiotrichaceae bacterium]|jgi:hypothetical protein|nr:DUF2063 domain-containing protein [Thiotrichaceae bacterium]HIM07737.1 DUF2063 domain-containing protein [Gammaproteobacteria bacterium]
MSLSTKNKANHFQDVQYVFTQHMRDPENNAAPENIEDRRIKIYRELVYNNIEGFMASSFPILRKIIEDEAWHRMMRDYVCNHQSHTPLFPKMPQEFIHYLEHERVEDSADYPFLLELAHYEWIETSIAMDSREISFEGIERQGDLLEGIPVLSSLAMPFAYQWPVHMISPDNLPEILPEQATYIVIYRDRQDEVGFIELNTVSAKLFEECSNENTRTGKEILLSIVEQLQHPNPEAVINGGLEIMQDFKSKDIILGTKE